MPKESGRKPNGIAHRDDFALAHDDEREGAFDAAEGAQDSAAIARRPGQKVEDDFAVGGGLENGAFAFQFVAQDVGVDEVAIVRDGELAAEAIDDKGLGIFHRARSGGGITGMADGPLALQTLQFRLPKNLRDKAHVAMQLEGRAGAVAGDDTGALLPAMLEREKPVISEHGRIRMTEDGEDAALVHRIGRLRRWKKFVLDHRPRKILIPRPTSRLRAAKRERRLLQIDSAEKTTLPVNISPRRAT